MGKGGGLSRGTELKNYDFGKRAAPSQRGEHARHRRAAEAGPYKRRARRIRIVHASRHGAAVPTHTSFPRAYSLPTKGPAECTVDDRQHPTQRCESDHQCRAEITDSRTPSWLRCTQGRPASSALTMRPYGFLTWIVYVAVLPLASATVTVLIPTVALVASTVMFNVAGPPALPGTTVQEVMVKPAPVHFPVRPLAGRLLADAFASPWFITASGVVRPALRSSFPTAERPCWRLPRRGWPLGSPVCSSN
jgi:hypothetical protein